MNLHDKAKLLRKKGKSFREIAKILDIPVSTSHLWGKEHWINRRTKGKSKTKIS